MTTLERYEGTAKVTARLEAVRGRHLLVQVAGAATGVVTVVCASLTAAALVGYWPGQPPWALRWGILAAMSAAWVAGALWFVLLPVRRRLNYHQTARLIEQSMGGLDNCLINAIQLGEDPAQISRPLVQGVIGETVRRTARLPLTSAVDTRSLKRWSISAGIAAAALCAFALLQGPRLSRGLAAVFSPTGYVRGIPTVKLASPIKPGDTTLLAGEELTIVAKIKNPQRRRYEATVEIRPLDPEAHDRRAGMKDAGRKMLPSPDRSTYSCRYGKLEQSIEYAVWIGDSRFPVDKPYYTVTVLQRLEVEGLDLLYTFPRYMNRSARSVAGAAGPIEAPLGTVVKVTLRLKTRGCPALGAVLRKRSGVSAPMRSDASGKAFTGLLRVTENDGYRIVLTDKAGRAVQQLPDAGAEASKESGIVDGHYSIRAVPDSPPKIAFVRPNRDVFVGPGGELATRIKASDIYGLAAVNLFVGREGRPPRMVREFEKARGKTSAELAFAIAVGGELRVGDVIVYHAAATDGRRLGNLGGPQTATTPKFKIIVRDAARIAAQRARAYELLRARLTKILAAQEKQRVNTEIVAKNLTDAGKARAAGQKILAGQQAIRVDILDVVEKFPFEPEMATIRQALALLGNNEAALAISQAQVLAAWHGRPAREKKDMAETAMPPTGQAHACQDLAKTQDKIIRSLQTMLAILPALRNPNAAKKTAGGEDLPPEAREKLAELKTALEKFIEAQKKIIQASDRLTKRPVDSFTAEDEKLLKELQAAQDKWEKFLNEAFTDFSKLAQQDFSNPSLLKELLSIKTDVTMAKDALSKKAVEIATALEDNGIENARTLTANIEKWLPDEPDRIKWDMEDPAAGQENVEQAELPKELEDLIGDLLEEEEDLFEEMDDITSKYTMSGDKGIGWDAMDGPISNMNAQGVTGNQLPNTSEVSGRSGEGRQGKSLGEFVEDKAVGKGGRRTPTRLTPEPFQAGQVNDTSAEPGGGATGGGKLSGAGAEGLEGPLPPPLKEQLKRMAGRHAQLLNKAERLKPAFEVTDYSNYQFLQAVALMGRLQSDLDNFRYRSALRRKSVTLAALKKTHQLLTGRIDVTTDSTLNLPKHIRDDIADAMKGKLPAEYTEALRKYFRRLSEQGHDKP